MNDRSQIDEAQRAEILRRVLTIEARQRLRNVSLVKPELVRRIEDWIVSMVLSGKLNRRLDEEDIKRILLQVSSKREFRIRRL